MNTLSRAAFALVSFASLALAGCATEPSSASVSDDALVAVTSTTGTVEQAEGLAFLEGRWEGTGWIQLGPGAPETFSQTETVRAQAGGHAISIEGLGTSNGKVVHDAYALLWQEGGRTRIRSFTSSGYTADGEAAVAGHSFTWGFTAGGREQRFTTTVGADGKWKETGEISLDGTTFHPFFEMTLTRVGR